MTTRQLKCKCGKVYRIDASMEGKQVKCKGCGATFQIPSSIQTESPDDVVDLQPGHHASAQPSDAVNAVGIAPLDNDPLDDDPLGLQDPGMNALPAKPPMNTPVATSYPQPYSQHGQAKSSSSAINSKVLVTILVVAGSVFVILGIAVTVAVILVPAETKTSAETSVSGDQPAERTNDPPDVQPPAPSPEEFVAPIEPSITPEEAGRLKQQIVDFQFQAGYARFEECRQLLLSPNGEFASIYCNERLLGSVWEISTDRLIADYPRVICFDHQSSLAIGYDQGSQMEAALFLFEPSNHANRMRIPGIAGYKTIGQFSGDDQTWMLTQRSHPEGRTVRQTQGGELKRLSVPLVPIIEETEWTSDLSERFFVRRWRELHRYDERTQQDQVIYISSLPGRHQAGFAADAKIGVMSNGTSVISVDLDTGEPIHTLEISNQRSPLFVEVAASGNACVIGFESQWRLKDPSRASPPDEAALIGNLELFDLRDNEIRWVRTLPVFALDAELTHRGDRLVTISQHGAESRLSYWDTKLEGSLDGHLPTTVSAFDLDSTQLVAEAVAAPNFSYDSFDRAAEQAALNSNENINTGDSIVELTDSELGFRLAQIPAIEHEIQVSEPVPFQVDYLTATPDLSTILVSSDYVIGDKLAVWNRVSEQVKVIDRGGDPLAGTPAISDDGQLIAVGASIYDVASGRISVSIDDATGDTETFTAIIMSNARFGPDNRMVSFIDSGILYQWNIERNHLTNLGEVVSDDDPIIIYSAVSADLETAYVADPDGVIYTFDSSSGSRNRLNEDLDGLSHTEFCLDSGFAAKLKYNTPMLLTDLRNEQVVTIENMEGWSIAGVAFAPLSNEMVLRLSLDSVRNARAYNQMQFVLFDLEDGHLTPIARFNSDGQQEPYHASRVNHDVAADGSRAVTMGTDKRIVIWSLEE